MIESYPLYWPQGWKRHSYYERSRFKQTFARARDMLINEIAKLGGTKTILSTNVPLRSDGLPYATAREPVNPGVAVYFNYSKTTMCFACDQYDLVRDNLWSIFLTIQALRGIKRWGASDMMERAFRGFTALPAASWKRILGFEDSNVITIENVESAFRKLAHSHHPDKGGDAAMFAELVSARDQARRELAR